MELEYTKRKISERHGRMNGKDSLKEKKEELAGRILRLARDSIIVNMRFMDTALARIQPVSKQGLNCVACDGEHMYYDSEAILRKCKQEPNWAMRVYLHVCLHCVFYHAFGYGKINKEDWGLASDIAVENIIMELGLNAAALSDDAERLEKLRVLKKNAGSLTAEKIYRNFRVNPLSNDGRRELARLFVQDAHIYWEKPEELVIDNEQWKKISERIKADLKTFSKDKNNSGSLKENLAEVTRERYNYRDILKRFMVMGEDMTVNDDEFDYIFYMYGLGQYGNMPLVEPLEYKDVKKVKDFAVVLDTSASCRGSIVQSFLEKTYQIMKEEESFFHQMNVHIIQCDNEVQSDTKITNDQEFEAFLKNGKLLGFGGTDFRPAFAYVDRMIENGEFDNFKGLIYFTDGYGIYPERMPAYDSMFVFLNLDGRVPDVPPWAIKVVLDEIEQIEK